MLSLCVALLPLNWVCWYFDLIVGLYMQVGYTVPGLPKPVSLSKHASNDARACPRVPTIAIRQKLLWPDVWWVEAVITAAICCILSAMATPHCFGLQSPFQKSLTVAFLQGTNLCSFNSLACFNRIFQLNLQQGLEKLRWGPLSPFSLFSRITANVPFLQHSLDLDQKPCSSIP